MGYRVSHLLIAMAVISVPLFYGCGRELFHPQ
jgi:hypothetical protein